MSTPAPPPDNLGQQFTRRPLVHADAVEPGKILVTGPASKEHPTGWSGTGVRQKGKSGWHVENEHSSQYAKAKNAQEVGHVLARMHGHAPGSFDVKYTKEY